MMTEYILPLRDLVVQPGLTVPVFLDNLTSVDAVKRAAAERHSIILAAQNTNAYPARPDDLYDIGTRADILQVLSLPDGTVHIMLQTTAPVRMTDIMVVDGIFTCRATDIPQIDDSMDERVAVLRDHVSDALRGILPPPGERRRGTLSPEKLRALTMDYPMPAFIDAIVQITDIAPDIAINILSAPTFLEKLTLLLEQLGMMLEIAKLDESIRKRVHQQMDSGRKEAILQEKLRAIQQEMGEDNDEMDAISLKKRIEQSGMPTDARDKAVSELKRLRNLQPMSAEASVIKTYLDELLAMPWNKSDKFEIDLAAARAELDRDHAGMVDVKERILEHLAVMKKTGNTHGTILCFVGAPGVGKTSLGKSVARALGRKYGRISLGGVSDEAHFRGHRKTYIGSQPGRIMDALKRAGANNPVIVLDEIDKMGRDHRGDPEAALLEVLDPEQNRAFRDHYLEVDFDLSNVLFIATANSLNISPALRDRMEIIELPSYSEDEKLQIARGHLIRRAAADTGWRADDVVISDAALRHLIQRYTAESGVRDLQRKLTAMLRKQLLKNDGADVTTEFTDKDIDAMLSATKNFGYGRKIGFGA